MGPWIVRETMSQNRIVLVYIVAMALVVPMLFAAPPTEGLEVKPDTSLADSLASFWGENSQDHSGCAISGAGDVNGDGFDDILIGAYLNADGGTYAGQTYLILGRESGWAMDTDLSTANASFWGEGSYEYSGISVSIAGDVNGDGFDDILIGAHLNDDGGYNAGQTYLILGKASGWAMDTNLSTADASFWGENVNDNSGYPVTGAGDVNGDGFDDLLIGAYENDDGGYNTGQTYLVLGKASGWAMDTDLSAADASFRGEGSSDHSGRSVSGAGDVNGDGFDDILIGASGNDEGGDGAGQAYLILGKASGWAMDTNLSAADASFWGESGFDIAGNGLSGAGDVNADGFDDILIGAYYSGEGGAEAGQTYVIFGKRYGWAMDTNLSTADASFLGEDSGDYSGYAVSGTGDVNADGFDDLLIGAYEDEDGGERAGQTYLVLGKSSGWAMDTDLSAADASFWGEAEIDYSGLAVAGAGDVNGDGYDDILIGALFNDEGGENTGQTYLICFDLAPPEVLEDSTPSEATTGDEFTFTVSVLDHFSVADVSVEFWFGDSQDHINRSMVMSSGDRQNGTWILDITIPSDSLKPLHYLISAVDPEGNLNQTAERRVNVTDNDGPAFGTFTDYAHVTTGQVLEFSLNVTDLSGVQEVRLIYQYAFAFSPTYNISMIPKEVDAGGNGSYTVDNITVYPSRDNDLIYYFLAVDGSGNWNISSPTFAKVVDDDRPQLDEDLSDTVAFTGSPFEFTINLTDNVHIGDVAVEYWFGEDPSGTVNASMSPVGAWSRRGTFSLSILVPLGSIEPLHYQFAISDRSGNWNRSATVSVDVTDNIDPIAVAGEDIRVDVGGTVDLDGSASSDNVGILRHSWTFTYDDRDIMWEEASMSWTFDLPGVYVVTLSVEDTSHNVGTDTVEVTVVDAQPPVADAGEDIEVDQHTTVTFDGSGSSDNVGVVEHLWVFTYDEVQVDLFGVSPEFTFDIAGVYEVDLVVTDAAFNIELDNLTVTVRDTEPPVAMAGQDRVFMEGAIVVFDDAGSSDNVGVVSWAWTVTGEGVDETLEGETVSFVFTDEGTYTVTLEVSDVRGNTADDTIVVTIEERQTSDPPEPDDEGGLSVAMVGIILAIVIVAVLVAVVLMMKSRSGT